MNVSDDSMPLGTDILSLAPGRYSVDGVTTEWEAMNLPLSAWHYEIVVYASENKAGLTQNFKVVTVYPSYSINEYTNRMGYDGDWTGWVKIATATPPQVYDLPLAAGFTAYVPCQYWKTQEGEVKTCCRIKFSNGITSPIRLFSLPEGYRPCNPMSVLTKVDVNGMQYFAHVDLGQNGDATMYMATNDSLGGDGIVTMDQFVFISA